MLEPHMEQMMNQLVGEVENQYIHQLEEANQKIRHLEDQLEIYKNNTNYVSKEDYDQLQQRLRTEQNDHMQANRELRSLETRLQEQINKTERLEYDLKRQNNDATSSVQQIKQKDDQIKDLRKQIDSFQALSLKYRQETMDFMADNKKLESDYRRLEAHITDLDAALSLVSQRNEDLTKALTESHDQLIHVQSDLNDEIEKNATLEHAINFMKNRKDKNVEDMNDSFPDFGKQKEESGMNIQQELIAAKHEIAAMKAQIDHYKEVEANNVRLEVALKKRTKQLESVNQLFDDKQMEAESYRAATEELQLKIIDYQDQLKHISNNYEVRMEYLKEQSEIHQKRADELFNLISSLEETNSELDGKLFEVRKRLEMYETGIYGLPEAISEMNHFKKMVSIRDAQLADIIHEINFYQKTITLLEKEFPKEFDFEAFYKKVDEGLSQIEIDKTEGRAVSLLDKAIAMHKTAQLGNIKVILGNENRPNKTVYYKVENGALTKLEDPKKVVDELTAVDPLEMTKNLQQEEELASESSIASYSSHKNPENDQLNEKFNDHKRQIVIPPKSKKYVGKGKFKKEKKENPTLNIAPECKDVETQFPEEIYYRRRSSLYGISHPLDQEIHQRPTRPFNEYDLNDEDMIGNLQRNYELAKKERNDLQNKLNLYQAEYETAQYELQRLRAQFQQSPGLNPHQQMNPNMNPQMQPNMMLNMMQPGMSMMPPMMNPNLMQNGVSDQQMMEMQMMQQLYQQQQQEQGHGNNENQENQPAVIQPSNSPSSPRKINSKNHSSDSENLLSPSTSSPSSNKAKGILQHIHDSNEETKKQNKVFSPKKNPQMNSPRMSFDYHNMQVMLQQQQQQQLSQQLQQNSQISPFNSFSQLRLGQLAPAPQMMSKPETKETFVQHAETPLAGITLYLKKSVDWAIECPRPPPLTFISNSETFQLPTPEELEIINAKRNALKNEVEALLKKAAEDKQTYEDALSTVKQRDQALIELQQTIKTLEKQLAEQREAFQERLLGYKNEAERFVDAIRTEKNDIDGFDAARNSTDIPDRDNDLSKVSIRLHELESSNNQLRLELQDSQESTKLLHRRNKMLKQKMEEMEAEKREIVGRFSGNEKQQSLNGYASKLKMRYNEMKKNYEDLQVEYEELKRTKNTRFDPLMMSRVIDRAVDRSENTLTDKQIVTRMKNAELRAENLRVRNEEMHLLLGKANNTIDRLNQLLTRKESQLTGFHEQIADLRQQVALLQGKKTVSA
ncbi:hypothetical protein TRFO_25353 [Tritrichomonas foetus]|uniref:Uncharacterized protein n=1 Tax=Tritrichomonas foetus TaxID=1144522 RepID=A0A1J4K6K5_9EUKA|nr:hypothetical protein TRFO_25353 [Tritrichomonas foetus]|eukprot:OHT06602.1 hypothetical protein TRFO_25353 [Tritrichomonas foetus]